MRLTIGNKLMGGFIILSLIVVITGSTGLIMIRKVVRSGDVVLEEKVPVKDIAMEAVISADRALDACKSYLLAEDGLETIEEQITTHLADLDMFMAMVEYGTEAEEFRNSPAGARYVAQGLAIDAPQGSEEILLLLEEIKGHTSIFAEKSKELIDVHKSRVQYNFDYRGVRYELPAFLQAADLVQRRTYQALKDAVEYEVNFSGETNPAKSFFGEWYASYRIDDQEIQPLLEDVRDNNVKFHRVMADIMAADYGQKGSLLMRGMRYAVKLDQGYEKIQNYANAQIVSLESREDACVDAMFQASESMIALFEQLEELADNGMVKAQVESKHAQRASMWILILLMPCAVSIALLLGFFITRGITMPILQCVEFAKQVAQGDLSRQVEITSKDETRDLGDALNGMFGYLKGMAEVAD
ncbi:MAG: HAMP domain-containing protein, partial [bacterium]